MYDWNKLLYQTFSDTSWDVRGWIHVLKHLLLWCPPPLTHGIQLVLTNKAMATESLWSNHYTSDRGKHHHV